MKALEETPRLRVSYARYTPESLEHGEAEERGWIDEEGVLMEPDEFDIEDGLTATDLAASYLYEIGATEPSSSVWHPGLWYTAHKAEEDYRGGSYEDHSYHPVGFSEDQEREIFEKLQQMIQRERNRGRTFS